MTSLAARSATAAYGASQSNTHLFLCFQITQAPRITKELKPFWCNSTSWELIVLHRSSKSSPCPGARDWSPIDQSSWNQNCRAKMQEANRCSTDSSSWSHKGHRSEWGNPRLASLSAVHHRSCSTNHCAILCLGHQLVVLVSSDRVVDLAVQSVPRCLGSTYLKTLLSQLRCECILRNMSAWVCFVRVLGPFSSYYKDKYGFRDRTLVTDYSCIFIRPSRGAVLWKSS
jgi:hypothetical protein